MAQIIILNLLQYIATHTKSIFLKGTSQGRNMHHAYQCRRKHKSSHKWLHETAVRLWSDTLAPMTSDDPVLAFHHTFLHMAFLYVDLRNAIRWENGPHIVTHWKLWLPRCIATGCKNYAIESVHLLTSLYADFPRHLAYIAMHNRTVNVDGKPGRGKPIDQMTEHYILYVYRIS